MDVVFHTPGTESARHTRANARGVNKEQKLLEGPERGPGSAQTQLRLAVRHPEIPSATPTVSIPGATWHWETAAGAEAPCC